MKQCSIFSSFKFCSLEGLEKVNIKLGIIYSVLFVLIAWTCTLIRGEGGGEGLIEWVVNRVGLGLINFLL
jgi:hypothetical protein